MKIVVDRNIPWAEEAFRRLGEVTALPDSEINSLAVKEADILLVRTVTRVDKHLLNGSSVRFVASATIGFDHVDLEYLKGRGIGFSHAPGCNANSVAEYVIAALLILSCQQGFSLQGKTMGVVGVGNVGSRVVEKASILGLRLLRNDPPLARKTGKGHFRPLKELLDQADILTFHPPLIYEGEEATYHIVDENLLKRMKEGSILINTSRGAVADSQDLLSGLRSGKLGGAVIDVWEGEPEVSLELLGAAALGTPHIAGYSRDGKANATVMIYEAACRFLGVSEAWKPTDLPAAPCPRIEVNRERGNDEDILARVVGKAYDLEADNRALRGILELPVPERGPYFQRLRNEYPVRREFANIEVEINPDKQSARQKLKALGFRINSSKKRKESTLIKQSQ